MTRCIGYAASSPPRMRGSATAVKPGCVVSSILVTPTEKSALRRKCGLGGLKSLDWG